MKTSQTIIIKRNDKLDKGAMVRQYSLHYLDRFVTWFDTKSGAITPEE